MTYPYIGKGTESGSIVLFYEREQGVTLKSKSWASEDLEFHTQIDEDYFKNITADYLRNTKVKIESGEHRGFIQKMINGSDLYTIRNGDVLYIMSQHRDKNTCKEITLPLPPKEGEEWPQVGDEVQTSDGVGAVKLLPDSKGYYVISIKDEYYQYQLDELSKPKTPEQELRDEITRVMQRNLTYEQMVNDLIDNFNITKKPQ